MPDLFLANSDAKVLYLGVAVEEKPEFIKYVRELDKSAETDNAGQLPR